MLGMHRASPSTAIYSKNRAGEIRTRDLLNPIQAHYQAVLRPEILEGGKLTGCEEKGRGF